MVFIGCEFNESLPQKFVVFKKDLIGKWKIIDNKDYPIVIISNNNREYIFKTYETNSDKSQEISAYLYDLDYLKILQLNFGIKKKPFFGRYELLKIDFLSKDKILLTHIDFAKFKEIGDDYNKSNKLKKYDYADVPSSLIYKLIKENKDTLFLNTKHALLNKVE
ncbi:hypothetical protein [Arcobacter sp. F2176]|uniref:hypothetical protein n=1 Tax=Arcobacter sp. F2176 TaxID=2044511 RepID=UPI00100BB49C|nr:hypothetical protein [Arcobacter sp. F2176]RXJ79032.1 hypothetical protein CRU95_15400 [Arcobacter sp. F2176]